MKLKLNPRKHGFKSLFIRAIPVKREYQDLGNIWSREVRWGVKLQTKHGLSTLAQKGDVTKHVFSPTSADHGKPALA